MAHNLTAARPYARAIFDGVENSAFWLDALRVLSLTIQESAVANMLNNPQISVQTWRDFFNSILQQSLKTKLQPIEKKLHNLIALLVENKRLTLLPDIELVYQNLLTESEGLEEIEAISAFPMNVEQIAELKAALEKRLNCRINLTTKTDADLIGGVLIRNEHKNWALDYSVKEQLNRLKQNLMQL